MIIIVHFIATAICLARKEIATNAIQSKRIAAKDPYNIPMYVHAKGVKIKIAMLGKVLTREAVAVYRKSIFGEPSCDNFEMAFMVVGGFPPTTGRKETLGSYVIHQPTQLNVTPLLSSA